MIKLISFRVFKGFLKKELLQVLRDPRMRVLLLVAPLVQLTVFGVAISTDVKNLKLWAPVSNQDYLLEDIYQRALGSGWFLQAVGDRNLDPYQLLRSGQADAAIIPPPGGITKAAGRGTAEVQLLVNAMNVIQAQATEQYIKTITNQVLNLDLKEKRETNSINSGNAGSSVSSINIVNPSTFNPVNPINTINPVNPVNPINPVNFVVRVLYNPDLDTALFMVPGVMVLLICIVTIVLTSQSIAREKEMGTFEMLISAPLSASEVIIGKTVPFVFLGMIDVALILCVVLFIFRIPLQGSLAVLLLASFVFVWTAVAIGTLISTFAKNQQQSTLASFLFLFPAILLSGLLFPLENMPRVLTWLSFFDPISHYLVLVRNIMLKGGEFSFVVYHIGVLFVMAVIITWISFKRFHTTLA